MNSVKFAWFLIDYVLVALKFSVFCQKWEERSKPFLKGRREILV